MNGSYKNRIKKVVAALKKDNACLVLSSAPELVRTRDQFYRYRQDSDFFYLTGSVDPSLSLLVTSKMKRPLLIVPPVDKVKALWDGPPADYSKIAHAIGAELLVTKDSLTDLRVRVKGHDTLYHQNRAGTVSDRLSKELQLLPSHQRGQFPTTFIHCDALLEEMRLLKDAQEVRMIKEACAITSHAIMGSAAMIKPGTPEKAIAKTVDYWFGMLDSEPGFDTIAATGKSAATLHYTKCDQLLRRGDLFLLDCGAEYKMYNGDITRTFPVGGKFSEIHGILYDIVLEAQKAAIKKVTHGVLLKKVYNAAAEVLIDGLLALKILKGNRSKLLEKGAHKPFFPHGIGHSLGIDVHDVGKHRGNNETILKEGMVFTIEPGLYFAKKTGIVSPCGIRIEDDVLVKKNGVEVLTAMMPKELEEIEVLVS